MKDIGDFGRSLAVRLVALAICLSAAAVSEAQDRTQVIGFYGTVKDVAGRKQDWVWFEIGRVDPDPIKTYVMTPHTWNAPGTYMGYFERIGSSQPVARTSDVFWVRNAWQWTYKGWRRVRLQPMLRMLRPGDVANTSINWNLVLTPMP